LGGQHRRCGNPHHERTAIPAGSCHGLAGKMKRMLTGSIRRRFDAYASVTRYKNIYREEPRVTGQPKKKKAAQFQAIAARRSPPPRPHCGPASSKPLIPSLHLGFGETRLPVFESPFVPRAVGGETDIVSKECTRLRIAQLHSRLQFTDSEVLTAVESAIPGGIRTRCRIGSVQTTKKVDTTRGASQQLKPGFFSGSDKKFEAYVPFSFKRFFCSM